MDSRPIGIFDSGVGGVSVLKEIRRLLPKEEIVYLGDIARTPYGTKSASLIKRYSEEAFNFLVKKDVKLVVVACNTASSVAIPLLSARFPDVIDVIEPAVRKAVLTTKSKKVGVIGTKRTVAIPLLSARFPDVIDVIEPAVRKAVLTTKSKKVGVIGTKRTIESGVYQKRLFQSDSEIKVFALSCPLFVPLVEEGWLCHPITREVAKEYLSPLKGKIDTLILGCTHYPFISEVIKKVMGEVEIVTSSEATAEVCRQYLKEKDMLSLEGGRILFYTTDEPDCFIEIASSFLQIDIDKVERVEIEKR